MIIYKTSDNIELVFTNNKSIDFNSVINGLNYSKGGGIVKDGITVSHSVSYSPVGYSKPIITTKLQYGDKITYIIDDNIKFNFSDVHNFINEFNYFGKQAILNFKGNSFGGNFSKFKENSIRNYEGNIITFKRSSNISGNMKGIHNFIHRMKMDNGHMLIPIIKRYVNTIMLFKGKKKFLTGYANLHDYLNFIRNPSKDILNSFNEANTDSDFIVELNDNSPEINMKVSGVVDDKLMVDLFINGELKTKYIPEVVVPYILMTTKPIKLGNQTMPYFISRQQGMPIFISPLPLKSDEMVKSLKGGINLLK